MKECKAIVTNEGGITSHSAIISRELGIPCVIGTKHATEIFKDNDLIEVDGNNGIVKLVS
jgi:pyruvate,water dikinase